MDHAATTYVKPAVLDAMMPYLTRHYGNPSGIYQVSRDAKSALDKARDQVASVLHCTKSNEIYFYRRRHGGATTGR